MFLQRHMKTFKGTKDACVKKKKKSLRFVPKLAAEEQMCVRG